MSEYKTFISAGAFSSTEFDGGPRGSRYQAKAPRSSHFWFPDLAWRNRPLWYRTRVCSMPRPDELTVEQSRKDRARLTNLVIMHTSTPVVSPPMRNSPGELLERRTIPTSRIRSGRCQRTMVDPGGPP